MAFYLIAPASMYHEKVAPTQRLDGDETIDALRHPPALVTCDNMPQLNSTWKGPS